MPRVTLKANNFSSGEISPRLVGMTDQNRYQTAALRLENMIPLLQGGAVRRPGFIHAGHAAAPAGPVRLIPYVASRADAALLVVTPGRVRIFDAAGPVTNADGSLLELATAPWQTAAQLQQLDWAQDGDALYIVQGDFPPQRVRHVGGVGSRLWTLGPVPFITTPRDEIGHRFPGVTLTLAGRTAADSPMVVNSTLIATPSSRAFTIAGGGGSGDIGRFIEGAGGRARITGAVFADDGTGQGSLAASGSVYATVVEPFATAALAPAAPTASAWSLSDSPRSTLSFRNLTDHTPITSGEQAVGTLVELGLDSATPGWRLQDVGSWVDVDGGLVEITRYEGTADGGPYVQGYVRKTVPAAVIAPPVAWRLLQPLWSNATGWPRSVTLMEQRLVFGGNTVRPLDVWGSALGFPLDFAPGVLDSDAWDFRLAAEQAQQLRYVVGGRVLAGLCAGTEFSLSGGGAAITPTNVQLRSQTNHGAAPVRPLKVGTEVLFVSGAARKVRAFAYQLQSDSYAAPDMTVFSDHVTAPALADMAWQAEPDAILWLARADGVLLSVTYDRDQGVVAWARHPMADPDGTPAPVRAVAVLPLGDGQPDRLYIAVVRQGGLRIEALDQLDLPGPLRPGAVRVDAGVQLTPDAAGTVTLPHLAAGTPVDVVADGFDLGTLVVGPGGTLAVPAGAASVQAGVGFAATLVPTVPELAGPGASGALTATRKSRVLLQYLAGVGGTVDGAELPGQGMDALALDTPPVPATWSGELFKLGWDRGPQPTVVQQTRPAPFHVLAMITRIEANDG